MSEIPSDLVWKLLGAAGFFTFLGIVAGHLFTRRKTQAETHRTNAETLKIHADAESTHIEGQITLKNADNEHTRYLTDKVQSLVEKLIEYGPKFETSQMLVVECEREKAQKDKKIAEQMIEIAHLNNSIEIVVKENTLLDDQATEYRRRLREGGYDESLGKD